MGSKQKVRAYSTNKKKNQTQIAIMGDFNYTANNVLDRMYPQTVLTKGYQSSTG
ncbi:32799_t:CDS:2 [Gigaspora margarita]|uniref:32799_t:CDS:1 n=1 Tax=Gigaspora margarita TaxID=4874 RepID=A0ABN7V4K1_GIGMA|nr:32799_t:CDS:2 [Gigaspora margarita]